MEKRERLGSRLGFILLSAGCAIGVGNVWKFPWLCGQNGGGSFMLVYLLCLIVLGVPVMALELSIGRAAQASPIRMYQKLEKPGQKWHLHGWASLLGNISLMAFYTVVCGWIIYFFVSFLMGSAEGLTYQAAQANPFISTGYMAVTVAIGFGVLCFDLKGGLERVSKYMMTALFALLLVLVVHSLTLSGAAEGLKFYLVPDFSKITGSTIVAAMNQAFFTLSVGIGSMAIFGSYIEKERSLLGESISIVALDTLVAVMAGLIIFPACFTYGVEPGAGPSLLFNVMTTVFTNMAGGRVWGAVFFLFMSFAALSTVLAVCENILAMVRELTGWSRPKGALICALGVFAVSLTTSLSHSIITFEPFYAGSDWTDVWDFIVSSNLLPLGCFVMALFCGRKFGWGWENFETEANAGKGLKVGRTMRFHVRYTLPVLILFIWLYGIITYPYH